jgi:hypothetical protein
MSRITEEQFVLATMGISLTESENLMDFEREAYVDLAIKEKKNQLELFAMTAGMSHLPKTK